MTTTKEYLTYCDGKNELPERAFRISASSFSNFIITPWNWYRQQILELDKFEGSTASVIGTIVHAVAAMKAQNTEPDLAEIEQYIDNQRGNIDVDTYTVEESWRNMAMKLVNDYVLPNQKFYTSVEEFITYNLGDNIYVGGSIDAIQSELKTYNLNGFNITQEEYDKLSLEEQNACTLSSTSGMIVDYKTYNLATKPKSIPSYYKQQLLVYAWVLKKLGRTMDRIRLVYISREQDTRRISEKTGKAIGKLTPPELTVLTEDIQQSDLDFIESQIMLCKEKLLVDKDYPHMRRVIWHDPRYDDEGNVKE